MNTLSIANSAILWPLCGITLVVVLAQAMLFMRLAKKTAKQISLAPEVTNRAMRIGLVSAIGPALGVFIVMVGLMTSIGGPLSWLRLSIIGSAATELSNATFGATAAGVELGGEGYTPAIMAVSWFGMTLYGATTLVLIGCATPDLEKMKDTVSRGDPKRLAVFSTACGCGIFGYLNQNEILKGVNSSIAGIAGAVSMIVISKILAPKVPRIMEYALGIAMLVGMLCGLIYDTVVA